jgi:hypothetical protein
MLLGKAASRESKSECCRLLIAGLNNKEGQKESRVHIILVSYALKEVKTSNPKCHH